MAMTKLYNAFSSLVKSHTSETYSFQYYTDVTVRNKENKNDGWRPQYVC